LMPCPAAQAVKAHPHREVLANTAAANKKGGVMNARE